MALENDDIIFVPRSFIGDVNDVITKIEPLLNILLLPATYRDLYTTGGGLLFIFVEKRQLHDLELVHSTAPGEMSDPDWLQWVELR